MTQEEKELLLKDLLVRLLYGVKIHGVFPELDLDTDDIKDVVVDKTLDLQDIDWLLHDCGSIKPYLRPMSSMTEKEFQELHSICPHSSFNKTNVPGWIIGISGSDYGRISRIDEISKLIDWLNKKMFDYHKDDEGKTMIEKGLALEAPEGMYK